MSSRRSASKTADSSTDQLIEWLRTHRVNNLTELRRIERVAASSSANDQAKFQEPMTTAWKYYVDSNNLLNELRGLTRSYPFSSACLDEAKLLVLNDPASNRSWNFAWLCLNKIQDEDLIQKHADISAAKPEMWGGSTPDENQIKQLAACFAWAWAAAAEQMLKHWPSPPTATGC